MNKYIVITTINPKSEGIGRFESFDDWKIVLVGDKKSQTIKSSGNLIFLSIEDQKDLGYKFFELCPYNHYARKNLGYLYAIEQGAEVIYDTDDDNIPYEHWSVPKFVCNSQYLSNKRFVNAYKYFSKELIWPRGYPLDEIHSEAFSHVTENESVDVGVWQGLADDDPDVDALYRLIISPSMQKSIKFERKEPIFLNRSQYCPFNSQNTLWNKELFPLLYLPATVSFRFTDILRGYLAQRCMWEKELYLGFCSATVYQRRNEHNLMKDFKDEIECYINTKSIVNLIDSIDLNQNLCDSLLKLYSELALSGYVKESEVTILKAWIEDFNNLSL
ncbi:MAG: STELLO glycosyltransferase family protein [Nitrospinales bacterium]